MKFLACFIIILTAGLSHATMTISLQGGLKYSDEGWKSAGTYPTGAVRFDIGDDIWYANIAVDYVHSVYDKLNFENNELTQTTAHISEIRIGLRSYVGNRARFIFGGGLANIKADIKMETAAGTVRDKDSTGFSFFKNGIWMELGFDYAISDPVTIGVSLSYSEGSVECFGKTFDAGGLSGGLYLGLRWK